MPTRRLLKISWLTALASISMLAGCSDGDDENSVVLGACAEPAQALALPHPGWQSSATGLTPPDNDRVYGLLNAVRPGWAAQLPQIGGWPRRPTIVVPLDGVASSVQPETIELYGAATVGATLTQHQATFVAELHDAERALVIQPRDPLPPEVAEAVLVIPPTALTGALPLPVCGPAGGPHPAYAETIARLPTTAAAELALPFQLANTAEQLGQLYSSLKTTEVLTVESVQARTLDSFGSHSPPTEVATHLAATAASGILNLPSYQDDDDIMVVDASGLLTADGTTKPGFVVALPATGTAPYPFVLYQHGGSQDKENFLTLAGPLAEAGFAFVAIDLPGHGNREGANGGNDLDIINFDSPLATRDNLRQAAADHLAVLTGIAALNTALAPVLQVNQALDPARAHYMGLSLGGITGTFTFSAATELPIAALFVGGGGFPELLSHGLFSLFIKNDILAYEDAERAAALGLVEVLLDGADPLAYAPTESRQGDPRSVLFFEAMDDSIVANEATENWARAFGATLAKPLQQKVDGMSTVELPASGGFSWSAGGPTATRVLVQAPMAEVDIPSRHGGLITQSYSQQLVAHCFSTLASAGSCEVINTDFANH